MELLFFPLPITPPRKCDCCVEDADAETPLTMQISSFPPNAKDVKVVRRNRSSEAATTARTRRWTIYLLMQLSGKLRISEDLSSTGSNVLRALNSSAVLIFVWVDGTFRMFSDGRQIRASVEATRLPESSAESEIRRLLAARLRLCGIAVIVDARRGCGGRWRSGA